ncbi:MAG: hypothetical protein K2N22_07155 [Clostridia bacterium]|nr:hypothetical protein [Clostridia bacterium]
MEVHNEAEYKELLFLNKRLLIFTDMVNSVKDNVKALKCCEKLIKIELGSLKKSKTPISDEELNALIWRYKDFKDIVKRLRKTNDASVYGKAASDLDNLVKKTLEEIADLEENLLPPEEKEEKVSDLAASAKEIASKIGAAAKKVGSAVGGQVEKLKKMLAGGEDCE